jgi:hypothetical protein
MVESSSGRLRAPGGSHVSVPDGPISTSSAQSLEPRVTHEVTHEPKPPAPLPLAAYSQPGSRCAHKHASCARRPLRRRQKTAALPLSLPDLLFALRKT